MAFPGSVVSRALRSRLLRLQLERAGPKYELRSIRHLQQFHSTNAIYVKNDTLPFSERGTPPRQRASPLITSKENRDPQDLGDETEISLEGRNERLKEEDILMRIASRRDRETTLLKKQIKKELEWLEDPRALERRVSQLIRQDAVAKAAALVRQAQKRNMKCVASWNRLIQHCMGKGYIVPAFRFFNEMKKRGGRPNSQTFTILLTGYRDAGPRESPATVSKAENIYNSISKSNSGVELSVIHTNAMLNVCQQHGDMETLWRLASEMPEEGPLAPDMTTYTIILTGLRQQCLNETERMKKQHARVFKRRCQMLVEGKRVWADILYRWKSDKLALDNKVVNAMALLLQEGATDESLHEVLLLYNQTMGIPVLSEKPEERHKEYYIHHGWKRKAYENVSTRAADVPLLDINDQPIDWAKVGKDEGEEAYSVKEEEDEKDLKRVFDPIDVEAEELTLLKPDATDLAVIEDVCLDRTQGHGAGLAYWDLLTSESGPFRVQPDKVATCSYLRLLRAGRSSQKSVSVIREQLLRSNETNGTMFHIALSTCRRDIRNPSSLLHANELMHLMSKVNTLPDPRAITSYLKMYQALSQRPEYLFNMQGLTENEDAKMRTLQNIDLQDIGIKLQAKLLLLALESLRPHVAQLHEAVLKGVPDKNRWAALYAEIEPIPGYMVVRVMAWIRLLITEIFKPQYKSFLTAEQHQMLDSEADMLKIYSSKEIIEKLDKDMVYPSVEQRTAFMQSKHRMNKSGHSKALASDSTESEKSEGQSPLTQQ